MKCALLWGLVGLATALAAYSFATRAAVPSEPGIGSGEDVSGPAPPQMVVVTPANISGQGIPRDWALVRNGRGLSYWAAPEQWKTMERR